MYGFLLQPLYKERCEALWDSLKHRNKSTSLIYCLIYFYLGLFIFLNMSFIFCCCCLYNTSERKEDKWKLDIVVKKAVLISDECKHLFSEFVMYCKIHICCHEHFTSSRFIFQLAETLLFHWKNFPIVLPDSVTEQKANAAENGGEEYTVSCVIN